MTPSTPPIHVLIADSAQLRSQLIANALSRRPDFKISKCQLQASSITPFLQTHVVDLILANAEEYEDISQRLDELRHVHLARPQLPIVLLVSSYDHKLVAQTFRAGVRGLFCFVNADFRMLCKCLHCVHRGQVWASSDQLVMLLESLGHSSASLVAAVTGKSTLSPREEQVVVLVADGLSNRQVAAELALSENTIKKYMFRIFEKLGISSRLELALYAMKSEGVRTASQATTPSE